MNPPGYLGWIPVQGHLTPAGMMNYHAMLMIYKNKNCTPAC
jgi:hypothetical protein